jgi:ribosomal protein S18 acetylase RimI-like enzyme
MTWCHDAVLQWRGNNDLDPLCSTEVYADDAARGAMLESMGYRRNGTEFVAFQRSLEALVAPEVPDGFVVRGIRDEDVNSRATCQYEAFSPGSTTTPEVWRALMANAPGYERDLDTVVVASDGTVVAAALAWLDTANGIGCFEPVATRPSFQRRGLGAVTLQRGLQAMKAHGMRTAFVSTNATNVSARALYRSVGFTDRNHGFEYEWTGSATSGECP